MIVCPVCENPQAQGNVCDQCGKILVATKVPDLPPVSMPELEVTVHAGGRANVVSESMPELDVTRHRAGPDLPAQLVPDLDPSRTSVGEVAVQKMGEMDATRFEDAEPKTAAPVGAVTCRYCRNVQAEGLLCDKCGMRLPRVAAAPAALKLGGLDAQGLMKCTACGVQTLPDRRCGACGVFAATPE